MNVHDDQHDRPPFRLVGDRDGLPLRDGPSQTPQPPDPAHVAHELSNLLDGSLRNLSLALRRLNDQSPLATADGEAVQRLYDANCCMQDMAGLLKQWMNRRDADSLAGFADSGQTLGQAVEHALRTVTPVARQQGITLDVDLPHPLAQRPAGPLQPVIINGLRNAIEAVERDGQVALYAECDEQDVLTVSITDDGPGVADHLPRDRDGLVLPGVSTRTSGHGMGLVISRDIVRAIGGTIRLDNRPGGGAELTIRIPACCEETPR